MLDQVQTLTAFPTETWTHVRPLGRGGQSETALYSHAQTGELAAIKRLHARHVTDLKQLELFFREGAVLRTLAHPGIPHVIDVFVVRDGAGPAELYISQTFFDGQNLLDYLATAARPSPPQLKAWLHDLLEIASYLHTRLPPVFHRDIKPSNIIIAPDGRATLIDFGAVATGWARSDASTVVGTPGYTAPEQFSGVVGARTDLYSLGAVAWEIATGRTPMVDQDTGRLLVPEDLDYGLAGFIRATTSTIPSERPSSADAAKALLAGEPPHASSPVPQRAQKPKQNNRKRRRRTANSSDALFEGIYTSDPETDTDDSPDEEEALEYVEPEVIRPVPAPLPFELPALPPVPRPIDGEFRELLVEMVSHDPPINPWKWPTFATYAVTIGLGIGAFQNDGGVLLDALPFAIATVLGATGIWLNRGFNDRDKHFRTPEATVGGRLFIHGTMTTAKVLDRSHTGLLGGPWPYTVAFVFAAPNEPKFHSSGRIPKGFWPDCEPGATIGIVYNPDRPFENRILPWY